MTEIAKAIASEGHNKKSLADREGVSYRTMKARFQQLSQMQEYESYFRVRAHIISINQLRAYDEIFGLKPSENLWFIATPTVSQNYHFADQGELLSTALESVEFILSYPSPMLQSINLLHHNRNQS